MAARIVGLGQEWAGDDGVGPAVVRWLRVSLTPVPDSAVEERLEPAPHSAGMNRLFPAGRAAVPACSGEVGGGHGGPPHLKAAICVAEGEGTVTLQAPIPLTLSDASGQGHASIDFVEVAEATALITLLTDGADPVVIVDAVLDEGLAGRVLLIDPESDSISTHLLSTHGLGVLETIELARIAHPSDVARKISIVGITIQSAARGSNGLSPAVAAAVPIAATQALKLAGRSETTKPASG